MGEKSSIEWTDHTFSPWWGCTRVSPGCENCYAEAWAKRWGYGWGPKADRRRFGDKHWNEPLKWNAEAEREGIRRRVFCASMADVFEDRDDHAEDRARLWQLIDATPWLDWQLLTKRPENMRSMLPREWLDDPRRNVWIGTTCEDQRRADERIPHLLATPAAVRFLSCEPLLGAVDLTSVSFVEEDARGHINALTAEAWVDNSESPSAYANETDGIERVNWVIVGGESGPGARDMHADWAVSIVKQCRAAKVACFFKQAGAKLVDELGPVKLRDRKGGDLRELPAHMGLLPRDFPEVSR